MKTTTFISIALGSVLQLATADIVLQVNGPNGEVTGAMLDKGDTLVTSTKSNTLFRDATSVEVVNAGRIGPDGLPEACGCVAFVNPSCSGNPRFSFYNGTVVVPPGFQGNIGCYVCV